MSVEPWANVRLAESKRKPSNSTTCGSGRPSSCPYIGTLPLGPATGLVRNFLRTFGCSWSILLMSLGVIPTAFVLSWLEVPS